MLAAVRKLALVGALVALALVPWIIDNLFVLLLLELAGIMYLAALGLNLVFGFAGQVSLGHAALMGIGAYTSALLVSRYGQPFPIALICAGALAGAAGLLVGLPALRLSGAYLAMVTMAFNIIVVRLMVNWVSVTGGPDGLPGLPGAAIGSFVFDRRAYLYLIVGVCLLGWWLARNLVHSRYGLALLAIREDELAASSSGVPLYLYKVLVFGLSAIYAGVAGSLFAHLYRHISPISFGLEASIELLLAVILGGPGSLAWPIVGALIVTVLPQLPALHSLQEFRLLVYGGLILLATVVFRRGLAGVFERRASSQWRGAMSDERRAKSEGRLGARGADERAAAALLVTGVSKSFGGVVALDGFSIRVSAGSIQGLIGPNGSGKTTALNVISGAVQADNGRVVLDGRDITNFAPHARARLGIARTFQNLRLFAELSVLEHLLIGLHTSEAVGLGASLLGLPSASRWRQHALGRAVAVAEKLGLTGAEQARASELPHGLQRRAELGRALAASPRLLLLDEPAAGLSTQEMTALRETILEARAGGATVLLVEHHLELVLGLCDRVTVLDQGQVIADGLPEEVRRDERVARAYLGSKGQSRAEP